MSKKSFILRNLSTTIFLVVYLCLVVVHISNDGFILENQIGLLITMLPFVLFGVVLDFLGKRNKTLEAWIRILAQLLPLGIFLMQIVSTVFLYLGKESYDIFNYLIWLFLTVPLFIISYEKDEFRPKILKSTIGTGAIAVVYVYLTIQTKNLDGGYGAMIYFVSYFLMLYLATGIKKAPYLGTAIGIINAILLLLLRYVPMTADAKSFGWDYSISFHFELLVITTFIICILIRLVTAIKTKAIQE